MRIHAGLLPLLVLAVYAGSLFGESTDLRLDKVEQRLTDTEKKLAEKDKTINEKDAEIARLKAGPPATTQPADQATQDILSKIQSGQKPAEVNRSAASFQPDIAVIGDFKGSASTRSDHPARNRFDVGSLEIELRAAVDPRADAVATLPIVREVEDPLFFDPVAAESAVNTGIELEEAYINLHDFGVPNLVAKVGRFHLRFGRQNLLHSHNWPTFDNNFVNQSFLGGEALSDAGVSLSYVIPPKLLNNHYVEFVTEIISGEGGGEEAPVLNNDAMIDSPALNEHVLWNHDVSNNDNLELGASFLLGRHTDEAGNPRQALLYGLDATLLHVDPTGGFNNRVLQAECIYGDVGVSENDQQRAFGAYLLGQQQLDHDWYAGVRLDWTENALDHQQEVWGVSPYLTWYWSEFLRFRVEYQYKAGDVPTENNFYFQATWVFGAHPPHPYWAMK